MNAAGGRFAGRLDRKRVEHPGQLVDKTELMQAVWPNVVVEENNLNQSISAIRRALGESALEHRFIVTVPGRGYRFVAPVKTLSVPAQAAPVVPAPTLSPTPVSPAITGPAVTRIESSLAWLASLPLVFFGDPRFHFPAIPFAIVIAAWVIVTLWDRRGLSPPRRAQEALA